jgi:GT2 family glycosyltransferase
VRPNQSERSGLQLSIVISTLGNYGTLARVLDGYSRQDAPEGSFEVLVVMDAAEKEPGKVEEAIASRPYPLRRISGAVPGLSANRNAGWRAANAPVVMFTDNDTIPVRRLVSEHLRWHRRHPQEETCVLGRVRWARELKVTPFMRWLDSGIQFDYANMDGIDVGWGRFYGANASLKRLFIARVGDFDQVHFPYGYEDTDWAYRASKLGLRVLYNRRAVMDHLRPMTLEFWKKRARRVAAAEYQFSQLHPELPPWFHRVFSDALKTPRARGRGIRLAPFTPRWIPWLGPRVWGSVDAAYKQAIAPHFLEAWAEAASQGGGGGAQPDLSEWADAGDPAESSSGP